MVLWCQWIIVEFWNYYYYYYSKRIFNKFPWNYLLKCVKLLNSLWVLKLCSVLSNKYFYKHFISKLKIIFKFMSVKITKIRHKYTLCTLHACIYGWMCDELGRQKKKIINIISKQQFTHLYLFIAQFQLKCTKNDWDFLQCNLNQERNWWWWINKNRTDKN